MQQLAPTPMLAHARRAMVSAPVPAQGDGPARKDLRWHLLDLVKACRSALGLRDRDITVLRGLLSLMPPDPGLDQRVVFASNRVLIDRCDGIDERTLRRRIAQLADKSLLARRNSPNGKRYQLRDENRDPCLTYGIDLGPLFHAQVQLEDLAQDCARAAQRVTALRALIRDALYHATDVVDALHTEARLALRRSLTCAQLEDILQRLRTGQTRTADQPPATGLTASDGQNDRHIQRSETEDPDSEPGEEQIPDRPTSADDITLGECLSLASTASAMAPAPPRCWDDLLRLALMLAPAIGLRPASIHQAETCLGRHGVALAILGLVEACGRIRSPEAYLHSLVKRARDTRLDPVRMFRSLVSAPRAAGCLPG